MTPVQIALALAPVVPEIVRWITGGDEKSTEVAQKVVDMAEAVTGAKGMEAVQAIRANPEAMIAFRTRVMEIDAEQERAYLADRKNARDRDVALAQAGRTNRRADVMVLGAVVGLLACLVVLVKFQGQVPGEVVGIVSTVAGLFGACLRDAFQFEFGTSRGSMAKGDQQAELMADLVKALRKP